LDIIFYVIIFVLSQIFAMLALGVGRLLSKGVGFGDALMKTLEGQAGVSDAKSLVLISVISSLIVVFVFVWRRWSPSSREYIRTRPWAVLLWIVPLALGTIIPSLWLQDQFSIDVSDELEQALGGILSEPWGYFAVGILAPLAEEMVFRGAVLRTLLTLFNRRWHWAAIALSALIFALVHGNLAQGLHAFLLGLLLGWLFYRSGSIVPGVVLHWVNNTVAYVAYNLLPQSADMTLLELFKGNERSVWMALAFSACLFLPSLFQLAMRMRKS